MNPTAFDTAALPPLHDATQWPLRMTRAEVAHVCRRSVRWVEIRMKRGTFPRPDGDGMWARAVVQRYVEGGIKAYERVPDKTRRFLQSHRSA